MDGDVNLFARNAHSAQRLVRHRLIPGDVKAEEHGMISSADTLRSGPHRKVCRFSQFTTGASNAGRASVLVCVASEAARKDAPSLLQLDAPHWGPKTYLKASICRQETSDLSWLLEIS